jgi:hypothetical protein
VCVGYSRSSGDFRAISSRDRVSGRRKPNVDDRGKSKTQNFGGDTQKASFHFWCWDLKRVCPIRLNYEKSQFKWRGNFSGPIAVKQCPLN